MACSTPSISSFWWAFHTIHQQLWWALAEGTSRILVWRGRANGTVRVFPLHPLHASCICLLWGSTDVAGKCRTQKCRAHSDSFHRQRLEASFLQILAVRQPPGECRPGWISLLCWGSCSESAFSYSNCPSLKQWSGSLLSLYFSQVNKHSYKEETY